MEAPDFAETARPGQTAPPSGPPSAAAGTVAPVKTTGSTIETAPVQQPSFPAAQTASSISRQPLAGAPASPPAPIFPATAPAGRPVLRARLNPATQVTPPATQNGAAADPERAEVAAGNVPVTTTPEANLAAPGRTEPLTSQSALRKEPRTVDELENETVSVLAEVGPDRPETVQTTEIVQTIETVQTADDAAAEMLAPGTDDVPLTSDGPASDGPASDSPASNDQTEAASPPSASRPLDQTVPVLGAPLPDDRSAQLPVAADVRPENLLQAALLPREPETRQSETGLQATEQASVQQPARPGGSEAGGASAFQGAASARESLIPVPAPADGEPRAPRDLAAQNPDPLQDQPASVLDAALVMTPTTNLLPAASGLPDQPGQVQADAVMADSESFATALPSSALSSREQPGSEQPGSEQPGSDQFAPDRAGLKQSTSDRLSAPASAPAQPAPTPAETGQRGPEQAAPVQASRLSGPATEVTPPAALASAPADAAAPGRDLPQGGEPLSTGERPKGVGDAEAVAADQTTQRSLASENLPPRDLLGSDMARNAASGLLMAPGTGAELVMRETPLDAAPEPAQMPQGLTRLPTAQPLFPRQSLEGQTGSQAAPEHAEADLPDASTSGDRSINFRPLSVDSEPGSTVQSGPPLGAQASGTQLADRRSSVAQLLAAQSPDAGPPDAGSPDAGSPDTRSPATQLPGVQPSDSQVAGMQALDTQPPSMQPLPAGTNPALPLPVQLPSTQLPSIPPPTTLPVQAQSQSAQSLLSRSQSAQSQSAQSQSTQARAIQPPVSQPLPSPLSRQEQTLQAALADPAARESLPLSVRARLAPLLGRGLGETQLLRTAAAAAATSAAAADALAVGDTVLLSPGQDLSSPRGLGLLAHELTHVLRQRDPGFVPAVVRGARAGVAGSNTGQTRSDLAGGLPSAAPDEEGLAEQVEGLVREQFERRGRQQAAGGGFTAPAASAPSAEKQSWGGLPAPWEAMPFWDAPETPPTPSAGPPRPTVSARTRPGTGSAGSRGPAGQNSSAGTGAVPLAQAASTTRSVPGSGSSEEAAKPALPAVGSDKNKARNTPDLDRLAQQVYSLIKGRLHTEIRRDR